MKAFSAIFQNSHDILSIADLKTDKLVFLNALAKEQFMVESDSEYMDKTFREFFELEFTAAEFVSHNQLVDGELSTFIHSYGKKAQKFTVVSASLSIGGVQYLCSVWQPHYSEVAKRIMTQKDVERGFYLSIKKFMTLETPRSSIEGTLTYLVNTFEAARAFIFSINKDQTITLDLELKRPELISLDKYFSRGKNDAIDTWIENFNQDKMVIIRNNSDLRLRFPILANFLTHEEIRTTIMCPIFLNKNLYGFFGIADFNVFYLPRINSIMRLLSYFLGAAIRSNHLISKLKDISNRDQLTGMLNRHALIASVSSISKVYNLGVVFCDVSGLKVVNDTFGHEAGDDLIKRACQSLKTVFNLSDIYRIGGDEFVVLSFKSPKDVFTQKVKQLPKVFTDNDCEVAIGSIFKDEYDGDIMTLVNEADNLMYKDKERHYAKKILEYKRNDHKGESVSNKLYTFYNDTMLDTELGHYLEGNYYSPAAVYEAISSENLPFYLVVGDVSKNVYYMTENLKNLLGYRSCLTPDFLNKLENHLSLKHDQESYRSLIASVFRQKVNNFEIKFRVRNKAGTMVLLDFRGLIKYIYENKEKRAVFFVGCFYRQDEALVVDPITNLPRTGTLTADLNDLIKNPEIKTFNMLGLSLNFWRDLNELRGISAADNMLSLLMSRIVASCGNETSFYRLEGLSFMAIIDYRSSAYTNVIVDKIAMTIEQFYKDYGISSSSSYSQVQLNYPYNGVTSKELIEIATMFVNYAKQSKQKFIIVDTKTIEEKNSYAKILDDLERDIINNFDNMKLKLVPVVDCRTRDIVRVEAHAVYTHLGREYSLTALQGELGQKLYLIMKINEWQIDESLRVAQRIESLRSNIQVAFNLISNNSIDTIQLAYLLMDKLKLENVAKEAVCLELNAASLNYNLQFVSPLIQICRNEGITVILSDFDTDYATFTSIMAYPVDIISVRTTDYGHNRSESFQHKEFLDSIAYACHKSGKRICLCDIDEEQACVLAGEVQADYMQGNYLYQEMDVMDVYSLLAGVHEGTTQVAHA